MCVFADVNTMWVGCVTRECFDAATLAALSASASTSDADSNRDKPVDEGDAASAAAGSTLVSSPSSSTSAAAVTCTGTATYAEAVAEGLSAATTGPVKFPALSVPTAGGLYDPCGFTAEWSATHVGLSASFYNEHNAPAAATTAAGASSSSAAAGGATAEPMSSSEPAAAAVAATADAAGAAVAAATRSRRASSAHSTSTTTTSSSTSSSESEETTGGAASKEGEDGVHTPPALHVPHDTDLPIELSDEDMAGITHALNTLNVVPVFLPAELHYAFASYCLAVLKPAMHNVLETGAQRLFPYASQLSYLSKWWTAYLAANELIAAVLLGIYKHGVSAAALLSCMMLYCIVCCFGIFYASAALGRIYDCARAFTHKSYALSAPPHSPLVITLTAGRDLAARLPAVHGAADPREAHRAAVRQPPRAGVFHALALPHLRDFPHRARARRAAGGGAGMRRRGLPLLQLRAALPALVQAAAGCVLSEPARGVARSGRQRQRRHGGYH